MAQKALQAAIGRSHDVDPLIRAILCAGIIVRTFALTSSGNGKKLETGIFSSMVDRVGDLVLINALFLVLYRALSADYTRLIGHSLKGNHPVAELLLLLRPLLRSRPGAPLGGLLGQHRQTVVHADYVSDDHVHHMPHFHAYRARVGALSDHSLWHAVGSFFAVARGDAGDCKDLSAEGVQREKRDHCGGGKNGLELYKVLKNDMAYGFNVYGFSMITRRFEANCRTTSGG